MTESDRASCALQAASSMSAAEFVKKFGATVHVNSRNDERNTADIERLLNNRSGSGANAETDRDGAPCVTSPEGPSTVIPSEVL